MEPLRAEEYRRVTRDIEGYPVTITSYRIADRWLCKIDNVSPGAVFARGEGSSRDEAENEALGLATNRLKLTRRLIDARQALDDALKMVDVPK